MNIEEMTDILPIAKLYEDHQLAKNDIKQPRDTDGMFHPSQMGGCTRKLWYAATMMIPRHRIDAKLRCCFDHGHVVHDWQQSEIAELLRSLSERNVKESGPDGLRFDADFEVRLSCPAYGNGVAEDLNIEGRADGLIVVQTDREEFGRVIYELKTMADSSWQKLTRPQARHIAQATIYAKCLDASTILFQYYNKNADQSKFFWASPDDVAWDNALEQVSEVRSALSRGEDVPAAYSMWECRTCGYYYDCQPEVR